MYLECNGGSWLQVVLAEKEIDIADEMRYREGLQETRVLCAVL